MRSIVALQGWAVAAWATEAAPQPGMLEQFMPFIFIFIIFFFFIIRPQQKRARAHRDFLAQIKRGDCVLTSGGIFGTIEGLTEKFVTLEVADGVRLRILRNQILSPVNKESK